MIGQVPIELSEDDFLELGEGSVLYDDHLFCVEVYESESVAIDQLDDIHISPLSVICREIVVHGIQVAFRSIPVESIAARRVIDNVVERFPYPLCPPEKADFLVGLTGSFWENLGDHLGCGSGDMCKFPGNLVGIGYLIAGPLSFGHRNDESMLGEAPSGNINGRSMHVSIPSYLGYHQRTPFSEGFIDDIGVFRKAESFEDPCEVHRINVFYLVHLVNVFSRKL